MSKSMWIPTEGDNLPVRDNDVPIISVDVVFWKENEYRPYWGNYNYSIKAWITTDHKGFVSSAIKADKVKYFAYIDNPYK